MKYLLLFSGGVDSVLCLWKLVNEMGIIPILIHFRTTKLTDAMERKIRRNARLISPKSPYYVFEAKTHDYHAVSSSDFMDYEVNLDDKGEKVFVPVEHADIVVLGYTKWIYTYTRTRVHFKDRTKSLFFEQVNKMNLPYLFPLAEYTRTRIDREFTCLPEEIRKNTISSTRAYNGDWSFVPPENWKGL